MIDLHQGDCLEVMATLPDASVDMIMCDLPYGTTACKWDTVIPFEPLWAQYRRVAKRSAAIVLTASQPFTSALVMSRPDLFRYEWIWEKSIATQFLDAKRKPLKKHENVCVFYAAQPTYNPQFTAGKPYRINPKAPPTGIYGRHVRVATDNDGKRYPMTVNHFTNERGLHPAQKPVALMEYMICTYTNEGDVVLDNCMGSGTTGVACVNARRSFIGIEQDAKYFEIAQRRIDEARGLFSEAA